MIRARFALAIVLIIPTIAFGQRKGKMGAGEGAAANWDDVAKDKAPAGPTIAAKDFEKASPFKLMLDKKKDLKLTDAQITAVKEADAKLLAANAQRFTLLDSLKKDARPKTSGTPAPEDEARMVIAREALNGVASDIRVSFDAAAKEGISGLDESQAKVREELMKKYTEEMQDMLRSKLGGARGGGDGKVPFSTGGRGGRPPA